MLHKENQSLNDVYNVDNKKELTASRREMVFARIISMLAVGLYVLVSYMLLEMRQEIEDLKAQADPLKTCIAINRVLPKDHRLVCG